MILSEAKSHTATDTQPLVPSASDLIAAAKSAMAGERRHYQRQVAVLLEAISQGVERLERLRARGLRGRALTEPETELSVARRELAELIRGREHEGTSLKNSLHRQEAPLPVVSAGSVPRARPAPCARVDGATRTPPGDETSARDPTRPDPPAGIPGERFAGG